MEFVNLFKPEEGRMGVTVTFVAILELVREGLIEIVQTEAYAPIHVRKGEGQRGLQAGGRQRRAKLDSAANEADIEGRATEHVDDLDDHDDPRNRDGLEPVATDLVGTPTDGEQHE